MHLCAKLTTAVAACLLACATPAMAATRPVTHKRKTRIRRGRSCSAGPGR
jgi:hypothetical protein